jgi:hypothetical protein
MVLAETNFVLRGVNLLNSGVEKSAPFFVAQNPGRGVIIHPTRNDLKCNSGGKKLPPNTSRGSPRSTKIQYKKCRRGGKR